MPRHTPRTSPWNASVLSSRRGPCVPEGKDCSPPRLARTAPAGRRVHYGASLCDYSEHRWVSIRRLNHSLRWTRWPNRSLLTTPSPNRLDPKRSGTL